MFGLLKGSMSFGGSVFSRMVFEIFCHGLFFCSVFRMTLEAFKVGLVDVWIFTS
jgi:hypothetical protein